MQGADVADFARTALWLLFKASLPLLLTSLAVGIAVALFQALTHIQEMSLVFIPKLISVLLVFFVLLTFYGDIFNSFSCTLFDRIAWIGAQDP